VANVALRIDVERSDIQFGPAVVGCLRRQCKKENGGCDQERFRSAMAW
jgi:hypothetical protein